MGYLDNHPMVFGYSELFNTFGIGLTIGKRPNHSQIALSLRNRFPLIFLKYMLRQVNKPQANAVGFKLMYDQLDRFPNIISYVQSHRVSIIHLTRNNLFYSYVSLRTAQQTGMWIGLHNHRINKVRLYIPISDCNEYFNTITYQEQHYRSLFQNNVPYLSVSYEELIHSGNRQLQKIFHFLGVSYIQTSSSISKQSKEKAERIVINYQELKKYFFRTQWGTFFKA